MKSGAAVGRRSRLRRTQPAESGWLACGAPAGGVPGGGGGPQLARALPVIGTGGPPMTLAPVVASATAFTREKISRASRRAPRRHPARVRSFRFPLSRRWERGRRHFETRPAPRPPRETAAASAAASHPGMPASGSCAAPSRAAGGRVPCCTGARIAHRSPSPEARSPRSGCWACPGRGGARLGSPDCRLQRGRTGFPRCWRRRRAGARTTHRASRPRPPPA